MICASAVDQFLEFFGHQTLLARAAIVGHDVSFVAGRPQFVFQDEQFFCARAGNADHVIAGLLQGPRRRQRDCGANASSDNNDGAEVLDLGGLSQWPHDVQNRIARFERVHQVRGFADRLNDQSDGAFIRVGALDCERNSLAIFVQTHDDELPWTLFAGDAGRFDLKLLDVAAQ